MSKVSVQSFLRTRGGRIASGALCVAALIALFIAVRSAFGPNELADRSRHRVYICSETGKSFEVVLEPGMSIPVRSPFSNKDTGFPAELCYWNADGTIRQKPTPVLLNSLIGKKGPTFCPDCGRLVVGHNPLPHEGMQPPLTEAEYQQKHPAAAPRY